MHLATNNQRPKNVISRYLYVSHQEIWRWGRPRMLFNCAARDPGSFSLSTFPCARCRLLLCLPPCGYKTAAIALTLCPTSSRTKKERQGVKKGKATLKSKNSFLLSKLYFLIQKEILAPGISTSISLAKIITYGSP